MVAPEMQYQLYKRPKAVNEVVWDRKKNQHLHMRPIHHKQPMHPTRYSQSAALYLIKSCSIL